MAFIVFIFYLVIAGAADIRPLLLEPTRRTEVLWTRSQPRAGLLKLRLPRSDSSCDSRRSGPAGSPGPLAPCMRRRPNAAATAL